MSTSEDERRRHLVLVKNVRDELAVARAKLCSHGIKRETCLQDHPTDEDTAAYHAKAQALADERAALKKQPGGEGA